MALPQLPSPPLRYPSRNTALLRAPSFLTQELTPRPSPVCVRTCRLRSKVSLKPFPQKLHRCLFTWLWHLRCRLSMRCRRKALPHRSQLCRAASPQVPVVNWGREGREVQCRVGGRGEGRGWPWLGLPRLPLKIPNRCRLWAARWNRAAPLHPCSYFQRRPAPSKWGWDQQPSGMHSMEAGGWCPSRPESFLLARAPAATLDPEGEASDEDGREKERSVGLITSQSPQRQP